MRFSQNALSAWFIRLQCHNSVSNTILGSETVFLRFMSLQDPCEVSGTVSQYVYIKTSLLVSSADCYLDLLLILYIWKFNQYTNTETAMLSKYIFPPPLMHSFFKVSATFLCSSVWRNAKSERNRFQILFWYQIFMILIPILFSIPNVFRFRYRSFFDTKFFWNQYRYFFWYQIFFNRYHQKTWTSFETELKLFSSKFVDWIMSLLKCRDP